MSTHDIFYGEIRKIRGAVKKLSKLFALSQKNILNIYQNFFFILCFFMVFPIYICTRLPSSGELLYSLCKPWSSPMAEVPIYSLNQSCPGLFVFSSGTFFWFWKQIKVTGGQGLGCTDNGTTIATWRIYRLVKKISATFEKCGKVIHPLKAGIL